MSGAVGAICRAWKGGPTKITKIVESRDVFHLVFLFLGESEGVVSTCYLVGLLIFHNRVDRNPSDLEAPQKCLQGLHLRATQQVLEAVKAADDLTHLADKKMCFWAKSGNLPPSCAVGQGAGVREGGKWRKKRKRKITKVNGT